VPTAHREGAAVILHRALFDRAACILILAQSNKLRVSQMAAFQSIPRIQFALRADFQRAKPEAIETGQSQQTLDLPTTEVAGLEWHGWYSLGRGVATTFGTM